MGETLQEIFKRGPRFEENILKAFENRKIVFFIGAGVSRVMGIPGWSDFSASLIRKAYPNYKERETILRDVTDNKERITIAYKQLESDNKLEDFYQCFKEAMTPNKDIVSTKTNIYQILSWFEATFLTTNADNLFEEVLGSELCHDDFELKYLLDEKYSRQNHLYYLHGHFSDNQESRRNLVFTAPQYVERYNDRRCIELLQTIFRGDKVILFIGYGLNEFELIDYIVTKTGYNAKTNRKVYVLYAFCDDQDLLFKAKKAYFDALNIEIIPYDISIKGYDSLIDVLQCLYDDYRSRTIVPIAQTISECISDFNPVNYAYIRRYLFDEKLAPSIEVQVTEDIRKTGNYSWIESFYKDGLFSSTQIDVKTNFRAWPLLDLFVDWVQTDSKEAQSAACEFLGRLSSEQISAIKNSNSFIGDNLVLMILSLVKENIQESHLEILEKLSQYRDFYLLSNNQPQSLDRLTTWNHILVKRLFDQLLKSVDVNGYNDVDYCIDQFFEKLNTAIKDTDFCLFVFEYFSELLKRSVPKDEYCPFLYIYDVDHVFDNHSYSQLKFVIKELELSFSKLSSEMKSTIIREIIADDNIALKKLAIFLARRNSINVSDILCDSGLFDFSQIYHETYLLLKAQMEKQFITPENQDRLTDIILKSTFEIETYRVETEEDKQYFYQLKQSKRMALLSLLSTDRSKQAVAKLKEEHTEPYPTQIIADDCDYGHVFYFDKSVKIDSKSFNGIPCNQWIDKLSAICDEISDGWTLDGYAEKFVQLVSDLDEASQNEILRSLQKLTLLKPTLRRFVLERINIKKETFNCVILVDAVLDLLEDMVPETVNDKNLPHSIFSILGESKIADKNIIIKALRIIKPWLKVSIDESTVSDNLQLLDKLINNADYDKYNALIHLWVIRKEIAGIELDVQECELLHDLLTNHDSNNVLKYTLCFHYQNLKFISPNYSELLFDEMVGSQPCDMTALMLCCANSRYVFTEIVERIKDTYLTNLIDLPVDCDDRILLDSFYGFIIAARYFEKISQEMYEAAYRDYDFIQYFFRTFRNWAEKEDYHAEAWLIPCWSYIKNKYTDTELAELAVSTLQTIDDIHEHSESLLQMYVDISVSGTPKEHIYLDESKIIPFLKINKKLCNVLFKNVYGKLTHIDIKKLKEVICEYNSQNLIREGKELLIGLVDQGKLSKKDEEELSKLLKD